MYDRIRGHPSLCVSILPVDMPVKDPALGSPLQREAARMWLMPAPSKAGPGGVAASGSQSQRALLYYDSGAMRNRQLI